MGFNKDELRTYRRQARNAVKGRKITSTKVRIAYEYYRLADIGINVDLEKLDEETVQLIMILKNQEEKKKKREMKKQKRKM